LNQLSIQCMQLLTGSIKFPSDQYSMPLPYNQENVSIQCLPFSL